MTAEVLSSIDSIDEDRWNAIVGHNRLICRHDYLRAVEASQINDCRYFYPVVYENGEIVAHTCVYFISTELDSFSQGLAKKTITGIRRAWKSFLMLRSVECGTPVALGTTISFRTGIDRKEALSLIVQEVEGIAANLGVGVVLFRDFYADELSFFDAFLASGYRRIYNLPGSRLTVRWKSMEDYLRSLRSQYRYRAKKRIATFGDKGGEMELLHDFGQHAGELAALWRNSYDRAKEYRREILPPVFFERIDSCLGGRSSTLVAKVDGKLAGFALLLHDDEILDWVFCGLDYACNETYCIYFNLLYNIVKTAIEGGFKAVDMGITTPLAKMEVGAEIVPLYMYMKHLNPIMNKIVPKAFEMMTPVNIPAQRRAFADHPAEPATNTMGSTA